MTSTLMSDEELNKEWEATLFNPDGEAKTLDSHIMPANLKDLIKQQQQAYADVIVGEDEPVRLHYDFCSELCAIQHRPAGQIENAQTARNQLRAEQRTRNEKGGKV